MRSFLAPVLLLALTPSAFAKEPRPLERARFLGPHPIVARLGGGYCYLDVPHLHPYEPDRPALFQQIGDAYVFVADPVPFGYEGQKTVFYGAHPAPAALAAELPVGPLYCALRGPHFHQYGAPAVPDYQVKDGVVFYVGPLGPEYERRRPRLEQALEDEYRPFVSLRPQVTVTPPAAWHGELWLPPPPAQVLRAPSAPPLVPQAPARVHLDRPQRGVLVAPSPPSLIITPPSPPGVLVLPAAPPAVILAPGMGPHPGKHKGWYKPKQKHRHGGGYD